MKQIVNKYHFCEEFKRCGRGTQFSYNGLRNLFDFLEELEDGTGEEVELDVVALCCDFTEYETLEEFQADYGNEYKTLEDVEEATMVIPDEDGSFIVSQF